MPDLAAERETPGTGLELVAVWGSGPGVVGAPPLDGVDNATLAARAATPAAVFGEVPQLADALRVDSGRDGVGAGARVEAGPRSGEGGGRGGPMNSDCWAWLNLCHTQFSVMLWTHP